MKTYSKEKFVALLEKSWMTEHWCSEIVHLFVSMPGECKCGKHYVDHDATRCRD